MNAAERILFLHIGKAYNHKTAFHQRYIDAMEEYSRENVKNELTAFLEFLLETGYCDADVYCEGNSAIDRYLNPKLR